MGTHFPFMEAPSFILVNNIIVTSRFEMVTSEFMVISTFMLTTSLMVFEHNLEHVSPVKNLFLVSDFKN